jgi:hypothetical protein
MLAFSESSSRRIRAGSGYRESKFSVARLPLKPNQFQVVAAPAQRLARCTPISGNFGRGNRLSPPQNG